ncbi:phage integrase central domain-containing protein [Aliamphritea hakodatensis]|uniref:phage integrase central domain-containing protein n=1 Tax=Aliamphritea hakodatensis TaxID=2895352 RepID=UPI0022FD988D|nr:tyrosine-type recombinase/integrase [Aliamphritea hakodatensis]
MGRKRKPGTEWLPQRVYKGKSAYEFHPKTGGAIRLVPLTASKAAVIRSYDEALAQLEMSQGTFKELVQKFLASPAFEELAVSTQKKYHQNARQVLKPFGKMQASNIKPEHIRQYMDLRGQQAQVTANREHSFMSKVFSWAYERGKVTANPCKGVRKFTEKARERYISDAEYTAILKCSDPIIQAVMEISYCCAARVGDVLKLQANQLQQEGIYIQQGKTGKAQIKAWSPRLQAAINTAKSFQVISSVNQVIANEQGQPLTYAAFRARWLKAKALAQEAYPNLSFEFTFHDIKAKSISDWSGDKQKFSGHKSFQMIATYDRKTEVVRTHD